MKRSILLLATLSCLLILGSCAPKNVAPPEWSFERNALEIAFQADSRLNEYNGKVHTLQVCIYQLKDPNGFNQLIESEDGLYKLLECGMFDGSVANYRSIIISPGDRRSIGLDRAEGAKYIGIVAGYAEIHKDRITRLLEVPVVVVKEGGIFRKQKVAKPYMLNAVFRLGPHQIETGIGD